MSSGRDRRRSTPCPASPEERALRAISTLLLVFACSEAPPLPATSSVPAAAEEPRYFWRSGYPGMWWRPGGLVADFERDARTCQRASREAHTTDAPGDRRDRAYRAFLDCMTSARWQRHIDGSAGSS